MPAHLARVVPSATRDLSWLECFLVHVSVDVSQGELPQTSMDVPIVLERALLLKALWSCIPLFVDAIGLLDPAQRSSRCFEAL